MEVLVDLAEGGGEARMLQDAFVSIRVGKERRQGRFDGARTVSFSAAAGKERSCRVDVFRHLGSGHVKLRGGDSEVADVDVPIGESGLPKVKWKLSVRRSVEAMATPAEREKRAQKNKDSAHEYWTKHSLDVELVDIIRQLLRDKPENPRAVLCSSIKKVMEPRGDFGDDDPMSGPEEEAPRPQPASAEHHPSMPSRPRSVEPSPSSGAAVVAGDLEGRRPAGPEDLASPRPGSGPSPVDKVVEEVLQAQFRPRSRSTVVEEGLREDDDPNDAVSVATAAECSAAAEESEGMRPDDAAPAAPAPAAPVAACSAAAAEGPEGALPSEATAAAQPKLLVPPKEGPFVEAAAAASSQPAGPFVEAAAAASSQPVAAQPKRHKLSGLAGLRKPEDLARCRPGSPWTLENSSDNMGSSRREGSCRNSTAGRPPLGPAVAEQNPVEGFFLTELEPSEPSARGAGNSTAEAPQPSAQGATAEAASPRQGGQLLPPRAVEAVRKASKGSRAFSSRADPEAVEKVRKASKASRAFSPRADPEAASLPDPVEEITRLVALYDFDPATIVWPYEQTQPLAVETGQQLQVLKDDLGEWVFGHVVGSPEVAGCFPRGIAVTLAEYRQIIATYEASIAPSIVNSPSPEASPQHRAASLDPPEIETVRRESKASRAASKASSVLSAVAEGSRLVALYDFDPSNMYWPYEQARPLAVLTGEQLQILFDDLGEWVFGHVVGNPDVAGYFPRCITVSLAEYRQIIASYEESRAPTIVQGAFPEAEEDEEMSRLGSITSHWSAERSTLSGRDTVRLRVTIERAMNLRNADWLDLSDPYVILEIRGGETKRFRTKAIIDNLHPVWEETYEFDYTLPRQLHFAVWDKDFGKRDDFLGKATLSPDLFWNDGFEGHVVLENAGKTDGKDALLFLKVERAPGPAA